MNKTKLYLTGTILFLCINVGTAADINSGPTSSSFNYRIDEITHRVEEIRAMDRSEMSKTERIEIKKELKELKKEARDMGLDDRVSISIGALIIILLVLIIIL